MCGIAGFLTPAADPGDQAILQRMTGTLTHRGPDDSGFFSDLAAGKYIIKRAAENLLA